MAGMCTILWFGCMEVCLYGGIERESVFLQDYSTIMKEFRIFHVKLPTGITHIELVRGEGTLPFAHFLKAGSCLNCPFLLLPPSCSPLSLSPSLLLSLFAGQHQLRGLQADQEAVCSAVHQ